MKLRHPDTDQLFIAPGYSDIVRLMWTSQWFKDPTVKKYMKGVARRHKVWTGGKVRTGSAEKFIEDLLEQGFFVREDS